MLSFALCVFTVLGAISRHASAVEFECFRDGAEERCSLVVNESLSVEVAGGNVAELSDRPGFHLSGDVILRTPARDYNLLAADLVFERLPAGSPIPFEVYGSAGAPIGELPVLGDFIQAAPRAGACQQL
jgi:hypothetical protein